MSPKCFFTHPLPTLLVFPLPSLRTLFRDASGTLDKNARFSPLYRQDGNKLSNDDMLKLLADFRKWVTSLRVIDCLKSLKGVFQKGKCAPPPPPSPSSSSSSTTQTHFFGFEEAMAKTKQVILSWAGLRRWQSCPSSWGTSTSPSTM